MNGTDDGSPGPEGDATEKRDPEGGSRDGGEAHPEGVGDGRMKHVRVALRSGERTEHGEVYLRHATSAFLVSPDESFPPEATTRYPKAELARLEVTQHHSACFLTTAVAGEGPTLDALRGFRDGALSRTPAGRALVRAYYALSPPVADTLARHPDSRTARAVRWLVRRCAALARLREGSRSRTGRAAASVALTLLYVVGMALALGGHACILVGEALRGDAPGAGARR